MSFGIFIESKPRLSEQFDIAAHYDVMEQLDADVHDNDELSYSEVETALLQIGSVPKKVFLPCFGTGRHIKHLLDFGVEQIVGVDLSPRCVAKARSQFLSEKRVTLVEADLLNWYSSLEFDAVILLGNSFADCIDYELLKNITISMANPLKTGGKFVMDYIGVNYLERCQIFAPKPTSWDSMLFGYPVKDTRTPRYDDKNKVMNIEVICREANTFREGKPSNEIVWQGNYQKLILQRKEVIELFKSANVQMHFVAKATQLNRYVDRHQKELGMISQSDWWIGTKQ